MKNLFTFLLVAIALSYSPHASAQNIVLSEDIQTLQCGANAETIKFGAWNFTTSYGYYKQACDAQDDSFIVIKYRYDKKFCNQVEFNLRCATAGYSCTSSPLQRTMGRWIFCQDGTVQRFDSLKNSLKNTDFSLSSTYKLNAKGDSVTVTTTIRANKDYSGGLNYVALLTDGGRDIQKTDGSWLRGVDKNYFRKSVNGAHGVALPAMKSGAVKVITNKCSVDRIQNTYQWSPTFNIVSMIQDWSNPNWSYYRDISSAATGHQL